mgnify:CR=1 FL=1
MNMKNLILMIILAFNLIGFSQKDTSSEWQSQIFIDLNASNKSLYTYYNQSNKVRETSINGKGSLELAYNIDYRIFKKLSAVGIASLTNYNKPAFASIKTGLGLKLFYVDHSYNYLTLQYGYHIPFSKNNFREGHQIKIGQVFDVANIFKKRLLVGLYYNYDFFYMENSKPLISNVFKSSSLKTSSFGISLGIKF